MASFHIDDDNDGIVVPVCSTKVDTPWNVLYLSMTTLIFFIFPIMILVFSYTVIIYKLEHRIYMSHNYTKERMRYHNHVIRMLCIVILVFFICALPFRAMILWIIFSPLSEILSFGIEKYYLFLYFSRMMFYLNSVLNPIIYTLMSTNFREKK